MLINKAYKFRLYPTLEQQILINKTIGCSRMVYNHYLNKKQELYKNNKQTLSCYECIKDLPRLSSEKEFLKEIDSMSLRCTLFDLDNAYNKFFKEKIGFPKYKSKFDKSTYRTNYIKNTYKGKTYENIKLDLINKTLTLPKLKEIKIRGYRNLNHINGRIINVTVIKEKDNTYYASVLVEEEITESIVKPTKIIGLDLGIKDIVITSSFEKYNNEKLILKYEKRIQRKQRRLSKKIKNSHNYNKLKQQIARLYKKLTNARKYLNHQITKKLVEENDIIVTESLKVKNMIKNHNLAKSLTDVTLSTILRQLQYKSKWQNKKMYQVDTFFPSSQICSKCGYKNPITKNLNIRNYTCPNCGCERDRDYNAAENIMFEGLKMYMQELAI